MTMVCPVQFGLFVSCVLDGEEMADGWSGSSVTVFLNFFQTWGADFCCTLRVDLYIHSVCCQRLLLLRNCITAANCQQLCLQL